MMVIQKKTAQIASAVLLSGAAIVSARAQAGDTMQELLKVLKEQGTISQEAYDRLSEAAKEEEAASNPPSFPDFNKKGKLEITSPDENFSFKIFGRLQADTAWYWDDESSGGTGTDLGSSTELRRARIGLGGKLWKHWKWKFETDFADGDADIKDAYIANTYFKPVNIQVGHFKEPFSLEQLTSSRFITFMERSLADAFVPERNLGAMVQYFGPFWSASAGVFGEGFTEDADKDINGGNGIGATGRITAAPLLREDRLLHLGGAISWRKPDDPDGGLRIRQRPESHVTDRRLVNTDDITGVDEFLRYGAEAAFAWGAFSLQGEYLYFDLNRDSQDVSFDGWYVYGSWFLTGESRAQFYKVEKGGVFDRVKPNNNFGFGNGWGAWELAARYSTIDLNDGDIAGGEEDNFTVGLNWYPVPNLRFTANYVKVLDIDGGDFDGAEPDAFQIRGQVDW